MSAQHSVKPGSSVEVELKKLHDANGHLTNVLVLDAARDPASPLHRRFTWDDAVAGYKYRLVQATKLIQAVSIVWQTQVLKAAAKGKMQVATVPVHLRNYPSVGHGMKTERSLALSDAQYRQHMIRAKLLAVNAAVLSVSDIKELDTFRQDVLTLVTTTAAALQIDLE